MKRALKILSSYVILFAAAIPLWACGTTFEVSVSWTSATTVKGSATIDGAVKTFEGVVGSDGCVQWDIDGCTGRVCGVQPGTPFKVTCKDPLLMEWPDAWTLTSATWSAPDLGVGGSLLVTPASSYILPPEFGVLVTDPGYSAYVLKLDAPGDVGPATFFLEMTFEVLPGSEDACLEGIDVAVVEFYDPAMTPFIVPTDPALGVDFTAFSPGDANVFCISGPTPVEKKTWGRIKSLYLDR